MLSPLPTSDIPIGFHNTIERPWIMSCFSLMRPRYLKSLMSDPTLKFSRNHDNFIRENWEAIRELTLVDPFRLGSILDILESTITVKGDIVECGSYKGGCGILIGLWLKENNINKKIHLLDSFAGLPEPHSSFDKGYKKGQFMSDLELIKSNVLKFDLEDSIILHQGWFRDTIPKIKDLNSISFLHIDCDLYTSTNDCFPQFYPKVVEGGAIVLDDYNDGGGGEKLAINDYLLANSIVEVIELGPAPQSFIIKGHSHKELIDISNQAYSVKDLKNNRIYLKWLIDNFDLDLIGLIDNCNNI